MNTDQARRIIAAHDAHDRALANLRNAGAMSSDDPRATELLESAGDVYAATRAALYLLENEFVPGEYTRLTLYSQGLADASSEPEKPSKAPAKADPPKDA